MKLRTIKHIFGFPSLFLHELSHVIFGLLFGLRITKMSFSSMTEDEIYGFVMFGGDGLAKSKFSEFFVSFSPILILITSIILLFISLNTWPFLVYVLLTLKLNFPSKQDFIRFFFYYELKKIHNDFSFDDNDEYMEYMFEDLTLIEIINKKTH